MQLVMNNRWYLKLVEKTKIHEPKQQNGSPTPLGRVSSLS